ncbi:MAG: N-formylglutamate amidohydrolase [Candidatus Aminicenantes bacterium]|nr:N-formylglutamate amidohydrolase [Candidatus Aminicenantes bacterium]
MPDTAPPLMKELLVVIPHSGIVIPAEISLDSLSDQFPELARNVDWYTNWLYDFRDLLGNRHLVFPYCSLILEANRRPDRVDDCVPLRDVHGRPVYRVGREPGRDLRLRLVEKYLRSFHRSIEDQIASGAECLLDGHSTVSARGMKDDQIDIMNFQHSALDDGPIRFSPPAYAEAYADELRKRLPDVRITVNASDYHDVYGHVAAAHSVNAAGRRGTRVPAIIQETNERLYKNPDRTPNVEAVNRLRKAFALALAAAWRRTRPQPEGVVSAPGGKRSSG